MLSPVSTCIVYIQDLHLSKILYDLYRPDDISNSLHRNQSWWQNGHRLADDIFKCIFLNENLWILIKISLKFVPKGPINNIPALVQVMAWHNSGDKPLSEPTMDMHHLASMS